MKIEDYEIVVIDEVEEEDGFGADVSIRLDTLEYLNIVDIHFTDYKLRITTVPGDDNDKVVRISVVKKAEWKD